MISLYAQSKGWQLSGVSVDVEYDNESIPRHFDVVVHLPDGLAPEQIERLRRVADSCPVRRAMEAGFSFDERIVTEPEVKAASRT
jgi:putative redox protein